jgi:uncharacterized alkaline shock family protein YloU
LPADIFKKCRRFFCNRGELIINSNKIPIQKGGTGMIPGKTIISEEVFSELAKTAMAKIESISTRTGQKISLVALARIVADKVSPQITVKKTDAIDNDNEELVIPAAVSFDLKVGVLYGQNIPSVVSRLRDTIRSEVEEITGYKVEKVDVTVEKLVKAEPERPEEE